MLLYELLDKKVPFEVIKNTATRFGTSAFIKGREVRFYGFKSDSKLDKWIVSFGEIKKGDSYASTEMTGSGGELDVLSMIANSMLELAATRHPRVIIFTASKGDRSRAAVYERMLKRIMPSGWTYKRNEDDSDEVYFTMEKK